MSKIFKHIGLIALMCFSFYLTDKTELVIKNNDDIMKKINEESKKYEQISIDAKIVEDTITPGTCSKIVNKEKSYYEMSKIGKYNTSLYEFEYKHPKISTLNNKKKYIIGGNNQLNNIYIFIKLTEENYEKIINRKYKNYNFYVTSEFFMNKKQYIERIVRNDNSILITNANFISLKKVSKEYQNITNKSIFCYLNNKDNAFLSNCSLIKSNSIYVQEKYYENYLLKIKKNLKNGLFVSVNFSTFDKEKEVFEKYIKSKGYNLSNVDKSINEC